ncbi:MAG: multidrug effflux MFS transporter [Pseudooceanicola sp.]
MSGRDPGLHRAELVALLAMLVATVAFSIDSMLPALPQIGQELSPGNPNSAQLILSAFIVGMGVGTLFSGPLSDAYGRKPVILWGAALYIFGALLAYLAPSLELMIAARLIQGVGAAGPRIVSLAIVRDFYSGREMARLMSFVMFIFTVFPALAPLIGSGIVALAGWRGIFAAFVLFALISSSWLGLRLPEPLPREARRPFRPAAIRTAIAEMAAIPMVRLSVLTQTLIFSTLFTSISLIQPVFDQFFDRADEFALWFFGIGMICASSSIVNARFVMKHGMRAIVTFTLRIILVLTAIMVAFRFAGLSPEAEFWVYAVWQTAIFYQMGLTVGNLNALAMEPLGHIAGTANSVIGAISTVTAGIIASLIAQLFSGTPMPLYLGTLIFTAAAFAISLRMQQLERRARA